MKRSEERRASIEAARKQLSTSGEKHTISNFAKILEVGEGTVNRWLNEMGDARKGMPTRKSAKDRYKAILDAAVEEAETHGLSNILRKNIALRAGVSEPMVNKHLGTLTHTKRLIMRKAIERKVLPIIAEGLALRDSHALKVPEALKKAALNSL
jgi:AcrR family transcriptional regulator